MLSGFSGIDGFAKGFIDAGYTLKNHFFSEIDKHAIANTLYNFKNAQYAGPIENVQNTKFPKLDVFTFGSPCQDFSLAGNRKGLAGNKSSLIWQAIRLIAKEKPNTFIWENVKGAFSSNAGADFWAIIKAFTEIGGYRLEWQLLNTSWFLPQNRERIYLVGHIAKGCTRDVFPFTDNDYIFRKTDSAEKAQAQAKGISSTLTRPDCADSTYIQIPSKAKTLTAGGNSGGLHSDMDVIPIQTPNRKVKQQNGRTIKESGEPAFTLTSTDQQGIYKEGELRRLSPTEWERLQGFPDGWTKSGLYNGVVKPISDTQRYKLLGNAVSVPVVREIAKRL